MLNKFLKLKIKNAFILFLLFQIIFATSAKSSSFLPDTLNKKRLHDVIAFEASAFAGTMYLLNEAWYKGYPRSSFHFFNDDKEWLQMDKMGHATTSCYIGNAGYYTLKWAGVENKKAIWYGGCLGSAYMLTIEILDGFSSQWGFSIGDFTANTFGSAVFISQQLAWNEQRVKLKWSYHQSEYAHYNPNELGSDLTQTWLKDYNGQTYWISGNIHSFLKKESKFPKWLNIAIGYGAEGMTGATNNPDSLNGKALPHFTRYRQFYISPDIDFTKIPTKSKFLKAVFYALNFLKFPAPSLEFSRKNKFTFRPLYF